MDDHTNYRQQRFLFSKTNLHEYPQTGHSDLPRKASNQEMIETSLSYDEDSERVVRTVTVTMADNNERCSILGDDYRKTATTQVVAVVQSAGDDDDFDFIVPKRKKKVMQGDIQDYVKIIVGGAYDGYYHDDQTQVDNDSITNYGSLAAEASMLGHCLEDALKRDCESSIFNLRHLEAISLRQVHQAGFKARSNNENMERHSMTQEQPRHNLPTFLKVEKIDPKTLLDMSLSKFIANSSHTIISKCNEIVSLASSDCTASFFEDSLGDTVSVSGDSVDSTEAIFRGSGGGAVPESGMSLDDAELIVESALESKQPVSCGHWDKVDAVSEMTEYQTDLTGCIDNSESVTKGADTKSESTLPTEIVEYVSEEIDDNTHPRCSAATDQAESVTRLGNSKKKVIDDNSESVAAASARSVKSWRTWRLFRARRRRTDSEIDKAPDLKSISASTFRTEQSEYTFGESVDDFDDGNTGGFKDVSKKQDGPLKEPLDVVICCMPSDLRV